ncbi:MAG: NlpC/P60 family protein [Pseudomonadota bacterium]
MDKRTTPARADVAAASLKGAVEAASYREGERREAARPATGLRTGPGAAEALQTELLFGEAFTVYDEADGWAWGQAERDGYVGYVEAPALRAPGGAPTHSVSAPLAAIYDAPSGKARATAWLSMNASLSVSGAAEAGFLPVQGGGFVFAEHAAPSGAFEQDHVAVAERFLGAPYVWGGRRGAGLDCSALVQAALYRTGRDCPRDSDQQFAALGAPIEAEARQRGDLVFWKGHVAILRDTETIVHANATHMAVSIDPLDAFAGRVEAETGLIIGYRRLASR